MPQKTITLPIVSSCHHIHHKDGYIIAYLPVDEDGQRLALFVPVGTTDIIIINLMHTDD